MAFLLSALPTPSSRFSLDFHGSAISSAVEILKAKLRIVSFPSAGRKTQKKPISDAENELRHAIMNLDARIKPRDWAINSQSWFDTILQISLTFVNVNLFYGRHYKNPRFLTQLLECCRTLEVPHWSDTEITPGKVTVHKVSGSLTNAVFFVSCPTLHYVPTLLLRIYGPSSGSLISRTKELNTLHILSSQYGIGPRIYGTFDNGRIEEYFESTTLTPADIRDAVTSRWIGGRMSELHLVDMSVVEMTPDEQRDASVKTNVSAWLEPAQAVLALPSMPEAVRLELDLGRFRDEWDKYMRWLSKVDDVNNGSRRVFAHNDAQCGNLLRLKQVKRGLEEHHQIVVVDFEYAGPNPAAYDIANHFHEWTANYHSSTPHLLDFSKYPTVQERRNFYTAYLRRNRAGIRGNQALMNKLDDQVKYWSPASHAMWAIWGIVQAREDVAGNIEQPEFEYVAYARCRMAAFRRELHSLGVLP